MDPQLNSLTVGAAELKEIEACLDEMRAEIDATCLMLLDHSGQVILARNRRGGPDETVVGALLAATFASSRELAKVLREHDFRTLIQQGDRENIYAELVADYWILAVVFRKQTLLGMVRVVAHRAARKLTDVHAQAQIADRERDRVVSANMRTSLKDTIDLLFNAPEEPASPPEVDYKWEAAS